MENKAKYIVILSIIFMFLGVISVSTAHEVHGATPLNNTTNNNITTKTFDWGWDYDKVVKKEGNYYKKYIKDIETCYYENDEYSYNNLKYLYSKHKTQTKYEKLKAEIFKYYWEVDDTYKYKGKGYIDYTRDIDITLYDKNGYFNYDYDVESKTVTFKLPKKYVAYAVDLTSSAKKYVKKNGKTSIKPDKYWNNKKIHSGVYIIFYKYKGKDYVKKVQTKAGKKKVIKIPKKAKIIDATGILIGKGKKIKVPDVIWYLKG